MYKAGFPLFGLLTVRPLKSFGQWLLNKEGVPRAEQMCVASIFADLSRQKTSHTLSSIHSLGFHRRPNVYHLHMHAFKGPIKRDHKQWWKYGDYPVFISIDEVLEMLDSGTLRAGMTGGI
jgi:hypothetical protein